MHLLQRLLEVLATSPGERGYKHVTIVPQVFDSEGEGLSADIDKHQALTAAIKAQGTSRAHECQKRYETARDTET